MDALLEADACVLVLPCGASAHLEFGYAVGAEKLTAVLFPTGFDLTEIGEHRFSGPCPACDLSGETLCKLPERKIEPELMAKMADRICIGRGELLEWAERFLK